MQYSGSLVTSILVKVGAPNVYSRVGTPIIKFLVKGGGGGALDQFCTFLCAAWINLISKLIYSVKHNTYTVN